MPTTHFINTSVKLTIVTHLSFSERIAIATLSYIDQRMRHHTRRKGVVNKRPLEVVTVAMQVAGVAAGAHSYGLAAPKKTGKDL